MDDGANLFLKEGFFDPDRQKEAPTELVKECMKDITRITGIENDEHASNNLDDSHAVRARTELIERIVACVVQRYGSQMQMR